MSGSGRLEEYGIDPVLGERLKVVRETVARNDDRLVYHVDSNGLRHGTFRRYSGKILLEEIVYKHGVFNGPFATFHPTNGKPWIKGTYVNGHRDGLFQHWYPDETLAHKCFYTRGALDGEMMDFYLNGKPMQQRFFVDGLPMGSLKTWNSNGILISDVVL